MAQKSSKDIILKMKQFSTAKDIKMATVKIDMDVYLLNSIIAFIYKESVLRTRKRLSNIAKLFSSIDHSAFENRPEQSARIWIIEKTLKCRLEDRMEESSIIKATLIEDSECEGLKRSLIDKIDELKIGYEESKKLIEKIDDMIQFGYVVTVKSLAYEILAYIDDDDYKTFKEINDILYQFGVAIVNIRRNNDSLTNDETFTLKEGSFESIVTDAVQKLRDKMKILRTGITRLNTILAPGYLAKRLYMYLAFPGGGKSQILLKSALDIKKYNKVSPKNPENNPAVLYITMENSIEETIERIFNMTVSSEDIRNYTPKQVIKKLRDGGALRLTDEDNINIIIKYFPNKAIDTSDLYRIISDLEDDGDEVIALILDYVKRIRPAERSKDEKEELKNITNELKNLATYYDIPVITAQQLNRTSASVVDAAIQNKKEDVAKLIGRDGVASAWEINSMVSPHSNVMSKNLFNCGNFLFDFIKNIICTNS